MVKSMTDGRLAERLGIIWHVSPLRMKVRRLLRDYPSPGSMLPEDWLVDVAIARGLFEFVRDPAEGQPFQAPPLDLFSNEELIVALCYTGGLDRPQMIRMAGRLISRVQLDLAILKRLVVLERAETIIAELARAALRCDPNHERWLDLWKTFGHAAGTRSPVIHWSRLAEPVVNRFYQPERWKLAS